MLTKAFITTTLVPKVEYIFKQTICCEQKGVGLKLKLLSLSEKSLVLLVVLSDKRKYLFRARLDPSLYASFQLAFKMFAPKIDAINLKIYERDFSCEYFPFPYVITSFIEGEIQKHWDDDTALLHVSQLATLHSKTYAYCRLYGGEQSNKINIQQLFEGCIYHWQQTQFALFNDSFVTDISKKLSAHFASVEAVFAAKRTFSMIHGDAHNLNIVIHNGVPCLIDWESCYIGDGALDFAKLFWPFSTAWQHKVSPEFKAKMLDKYQQVFEDRFFAERVEAWTLFSMFFNYLDHCTYQIEWDYVSRDIYDQRMTAKASIKQYLTEKWTTP